jgi:hypothetical protein
MIVIIIFIATDVMDPNPVASGQFPVMPHVMTLVYLLIMI